MEPEARQALAAALARVADGDREALDRAFFQLHPLLLGFCRRVLGDEQAEDAAQEALATLFSHVSRYETGRDPVPWALAFAANACRTLRKRQSRRREVPDPPDRPARSSPEEELLEAQLRLSVLETIGSLSPLDAETLRLALGERPAGATFRKRLERAAARFRAAWSVQ